MYLVLDYRGSVQESMGWNTKQVGRERMGWDGWGVVQYEMRKGRNESR